MSKLIDTEKLDFVSYQGIPDGYKDSFDSGVLYAMDLIDKQPAIDAVHVFRWIGCKERLPNVEEPVIVCFRWSCYGDYLIGRLERDLGNPIWHFEDFDMSGEDFDDVIAWMPLPQPYEMR